MPSRHAFTLVELLVVVVIIGAVSAVAVPSIVSAVGARKLDSSASILQGAIVGARDRAMGGRVVDLARPAGIRLSPSSTDPTIFDAIVPLQTAPDYTEGMVNTYPGEVYPAAITNGLPCLVLEESPIERWVKSPSGSWGPIVNPPVSWKWNARVGDQISIAGSQRYTVVGPIETVNAESFVNTSQVLTRVYTAPDGVTTATMTPEFLLLTNGIDDNHDGFPDNGWDGIDNDLDGVIDNVAEWEVEQWVSPAASNSVYDLTRRPVPGPSTDTQLLSVPVVLAKSKAVTNLSGSIDLMFRPDGTLYFPSVYGVPSRVGLSQASTVLWLEDRDGNHTAITLWHNGRIETD